MVYKYRAVPAKGPRQVLEGSFSKGLQVGYPVQGKRIAKTCTGARNYQEVHGQGGVHAQNVSQQLVALDEPLISLEVTHASRISTNSGTGLHLLNHIMMRLPHHASAMR